MLGGKLSYILQHLSLPGTQRAFQVVASLSCYRPDFIFHFCTSCQIINANECSCQRATFILTETRVYAYIYAGYNSP